VDLLLAARQRGFDAGLVAGRTEDARAEVLAGRPAILMLKLLNLPGARRDVFHYVVLDGFDPGHGLFRFQFGDGQGRWATLARLEKSWAAAGHTLLLVRRREETDDELRRGVALEGAARLEEATALYRSVLAVRPDSASAWVNLGNAQARQGRDEDAEEAYRRALRIAPEGRDALNNLAWLLLQAGRRLEEAEALATRATEPPGLDRPLAQDTLGRIQLARGRCEEAALTFAMALAAEGNPEATRADLREGLERSRRACGRPEPTATPGRD
jgi:tetratricopeptide (TPR) repeat protein